MKAAEKYLLAVIAFLCSIPATPQDATPLSSQYFNLRTLYNPAAAGMTATLTVTLDGRLDSVGAPSAPRSFTALADGGMDFGRARIGAGVTFMRGAAGKFSPMAASLSLSLGCRLGDGLLAFGLSGGVLRNKIYTESTTISGNDDDPDSPSDGDSKASATLSDDRPRSRVSAFDLGAGIFYTYRGLWLSASALHLLDPKYRYRKTGFVDDESNTYAEQLVTAARRTFYFGAGYNISLKKSLFDLEPSFFVSTNSLNTSVQATARLKYRKLLHVGVGYRSENIATLLAGVEYKGLLIAYSYDCGFRRQVDGYRLQAHEITACYAVTFDLSKKKAIGRKSVRIL